MNQCKPRLGLLFGRIIDLGDLLLWVKRTF